MLPVNLTIGRAQRDVTVEKQNYVPAMKSFNNRNGKSEGTKITV